MFDQLDGWQKIIMTKSGARAQILAYIVENRIKMTLEFGFQQRVDFEANHIKKNKMEVTKNPVPDSQRLDCIYDDVLLGFDRDHLVSNKRIQAQDPLEDVDLGNGIIKRPTFVSAKIEPILKS